MNHGVVQDFALVEFFDAEEAEETQDARNGHSIRGYNIRVHFCIPGVNAINIAMAVRKTTILLDFLLTIYHLLLVRFSLITYLTQKRPC